VENRKEKDSAITPRQVAQHPLGLFALNLFERFTNRIAPWVGIAATSFLLRQSPLAIGRMTVLGK
jgi:hypothetical protein